MPENIPKPIGAYDRLNALLRNKGFVEELEKIRKADKNSTDLEEEFYEKHKICSSDLSWLLGYSGGDYILAHSSEYDRLHSLLWNKGLARELEGIRKAYKDKNILIEKFHEKYNIHSEDVEWVLNHYAFTPKIEGVFPLSEKYSEEGIKGLCYEVFPAIPAYAINFKEVADCHFASVQAGRYPAISEGKYIAIRVDLSYLKREILSVIEQLLDGYAKEVNNSRYFEETRGMGKGFQYSIWHIYDLCSVGKKPNFTEVARKLSGKKGQARDNDQLAACLKAVKRAYRYAIQIMKSVEDEIEKEVDV